MALLALGCGDDGVATGTDATSTGSVATTTTATPTTGEPPTTSGEVTSDGTSGATGDAGTGSTSGEPDTTTTDSTGPACPPASEGCPCGPNDACDAPLLCTAGVCQPPPPPACGDGVVDDGEVCDDANPDNSDDCLDTCQSASCGDGFVHAGVEACDDANDVDTDDCPGTCQAAACGDGFVHAGVEACDDANDLDTDDCPGTCQAAVCGDGFVHAGAEACDDANNLDTDDCPGTCQAAKCGDGFVHAGVEACDDGNGVDNDACSNTCQLPVGCKNGQDCLVVASTGTGVVSLIEPVGYAVFDSFPGFVNALSVAPGPDGKLYVGQSNSIRTVDLVSKATAVIGGGLVNGSLYGITVRVDKIYASGSGMASIKVLTLAGADAGIVASPGGDNLRSTAFGPQGDFYLSSFGGGPGQRWSPGIVYVGTFGGGSGLSTGFGVTTRANGDVLIAGQNDAAYFIYSQLGVFKKKVPVNCVGQLRNIAADKNGRLYVGCYEANKVVVFDPTDISIKEIPISTPAGIAVLSVLP